jgi:hypothetical protein
MAINIQEQFQVNISLPIDSRLAAAGTAARDAISYKYDGMLVFDTVDRKTYVWNTVGLTYSLADLTGAGQTGYVSRWSSSTGLTASPIVVSNVSSNTNGRIGINTASATIREVFQVNSANTSSQPFVIHKGVSNNILASNWYNSGSDTYFDYFVGSSGIKFRSNGELWIMTRGASTIGMNTGDTLPNSNASTIFEDARVNFLKQVHFNSSGTSNSNSAALIRATSGFSTPLTPDYTWWYNDITGIYHPALDRIGMSISGTQRFILNSTGLLLSSTNNVAVPSARLHLDSGNSQASYLQFTSGTLTGTGAFTGFILGINTGGNPSFQSRYNDRSFLFGFSNGNTFYKMDRNVFTIYAAGDGENSATIANNGGYRTLYGTKAVNSIGVLGTYLKEIDSITLPNSCYFSVEATFTSGTLSTNPRQFRTNKIIAAFAINSTGTISTQNNGPGSTPSGLSLAMLSSSSTTKIGLGSLDWQTNNTIKFMQSFTDVSGRAMVSFKVVINTGVGQL